MGSFSELYISDFPIAVSKNSYYEDIVNMIFQKSDFSVLERNLSNRNMIVLGDAYTTNNELETVKAFLSTVQICRERLELFGANYKKAEIDFNNAIAKLRLEEYYEFTEDPNLTFKVYLESIKSTIDSKQKNMTIIIAPILLIDTPRK